MTAFRTPSVLAVALAGAVAAASAAEPPSSAVRPRTARGQVSFREPKPELPALSAAWIGGAPDFAAQPVLRREFVGPALPPRQAELRVASPGFCDVFFNGVRLTSTPIGFWTPFAHRVYVDAHDVTALVACGARNEIRLELGNGWWNPAPYRMWGRLDLRDHLATGTPCACAELALIGPDGTRRTIATSADGSWTAEEGLVTRDNVYTGVTVDATRSPGKPVAARALPGPKGRLVARGGAPRVVEIARETARSVTSPKPGAWVADFGANATGMPVVKLRGLRKGTRVTFRMGELLRPDGTVNVLTSCCGQIKDRNGFTAEQRDEYVASGAAEETFEPRFAFHVFRYVEIGGLADAPAKEDVGRALWSADVRDAGEFESSNPKLNALHAACRRTFRANLLGVQSDCAGREKFGYGGDLAATAESFAYNYDMREFYRKTVRDFLDEASVDGYFTETAPFVGVGDGVVAQCPSRRAGPIGWTVGAPIAVDVMVRHYGDLAIVREAYPAFARYLDLLARDHPDFLVPTCIGDHEALDKADAGLTATAHYFQYARLTARFAKLLRRDADARKWEELAKSIRGAFGAKWVKPGGLVGSGKQGEQAFALYHRLLPAGDIAAAHRILRADVKSRGGALSTGIFGTQYLLDWLPAHGDWALAGGIVLHEGFPGWMHMLERGATTVWETWRESDDTYSACHPMFGTCEQWMMKRLAGIEIPADAVGCDRVRIDPHPVPGVTGVRASYRTPRGEIRVAWTCEGGRMKTDVTLPAGVVRVK